MSIRKYNSHIQQVTHFIVTSGQSSCLLAQIIVEDNGAGKETIGTKAATNILEGVVGAVVVGVAKMKAVDARAAHVALEIENGMEVLVSFHTLTMYFGNFIQFIMYIRPT